jgi:hypothetical protein
MRLHRSIRTKNERDATLASVSNNDNGSHVVRYFLLRSIIIGFAFYLPACFSPQTRRVLRFIRDLEAVQVATDLFQRVIILTLLGLIIRGLSHLLRSAYASSPRRTQMALKKITQANESKGVWACTECSWESRKQIFYHPDPPNHLCPRQERRQPTFESSDE